MSESMGTPIEEGLSVHAEYGVGVTATTTDEVSGPVGNLVAADSSSVLVVMSSVPYYYC